MYLGWYCLQEEEFLVLKHALDKINHAIPTRYDLQIETQSLNTFKTDPFLLEAGATQQ